MMYRRPRAGLSIVSLLLANLALGQPSREGAVHAPLEKATDGTIVLGGGYFKPEDTTGLLKRVVDLAGGTDVSMVIIPTADPFLEPAIRTGSSTALIDYEKTTRLSFSRLGVSGVTVLHTRNRNVADSEEFVAPLRTANCVWIPGGDPQLLLDVYRNTRVERELRDVLNRGGAIAGDSAGALIIGQGLLEIDIDHPKRMPVVPENGLRLLPNVFVVPHVNRYKAGVAELGSKTFVSAHPEVVGILIEENTAMVIQRGQITRLIGNGRAGVVDGRSHEANSVVWLAGSQRYNLRTRALIQ